MRIEICKLGTTLFQAENNTLRVQLEASLSAISYLEQRLKFHLKTLLEQEPPLR